MTIPRIQLSGEEARQFSLKCQECGRRHVVYFISFSLENFPPGAYCYLCLVKRCRATGMIPFPLDEWLLDSLKLDLGLTRFTPPIEGNKYIIKGGKKHG